MTAGGEAASTFRTSYTIRRREFSARPADPTPVSLIATDHEAHAIGD